MSSGQIEKMKQQMERGRRDRDMARKKGTGIRWTVAAAACMALFVLLPNTSAGVAHAMSQLPILGRLLDIVTYRDYSYEDERHNAQVTIPEIVVNLPEGGGGTAPEVQENMEKTVEEINAQIHQISGQLVAEFEEGLKYEEGYQDMMVDSEMVSSTEMYWVDYTDVPDWNFEAITEDTSFYLNNEGDLVICFNEGDVAPMYMGCVEFVISREDLKDIWSYGE